MKRILLLIALFILSIAFNIKAQIIVNNFESVSNQTIWQKVYTTELSFKELADNIKHSGFFSNLNIIESSIAGNFKTIDADFKRTGFSEMNTPVYISRSFFEGFIVIDFKDGKYRVTLKNILLTQKYDDAVTEQGERSTLETWSQKNGKNEFKDAFTKIPSKILDYTFSKKFDFNGKKDDKNW